MDKKSLEETHKKLNVLKNKVDKPQESRILEFLAISITTILFNGFFYYYFISVVVMREDWDRKSFPRIKEYALNWFLFFALLTIGNYTALLLLLGWI